MNNMGNDLKLHEVLSRASLFLKEHHREPRVAELLLQHYLGVSRSIFFTMLHESVPDQVAIPFQRALEKHAETGVPIQHITGYASFYGREFHVNEHTLIPRPETEELVQNIIENAPEQPHTIVDVGTGSGIIAITLALELPDAEVYASDISGEALTVARGNAEQLGADVHFLQGNFLKPFISQKRTADIIVSNPPYISRSEETYLTDTVKKFDPGLALFAEEEGLAAYKKIIADVPKAAKPAAFIFFEIGHGQGEPVSALLKKQLPVSDIEVIKDINKKDRILKAHLHRTREK